MYQILKHQAWKRGQEKMLSPFFNWIIVGEKKKKNNPANSSYTREPTKYLIAPFTKNTLRTKKQNTKRFMKTPPKNAVLLQNVSE